MRHIHKKHQVTVKAEGEMSQPGAKGGQGCRQGKQGEAREECSWSRRGSRAPDLREDKRLPFQASWSTALPQQPESSNTEPFPRDQSMSRTHSQTRAHINTEQRQTGP